MLGSYGKRCCVTGMLAPELLRANHIMPWSESVEHRLNTCNGLCLFATFDAAFDRRSISFDVNFQPQVSSALRDLSADKETSSVFIRREGAPPICQRRICQILI